MRWPQYFPITSCTPHPPEFNPRDAQVDLAIAFESSGEANVELTSRLGIALVAAIEGSSRRTSLEEYDAARDLWRLSLLSNSIAAADVTSLDSLSARPSNRRTIGAEAWFWTHPEGRSHPPSSSLRPKRAVHRNSPHVLRRSRGYQPSAASRWRSCQPVSPPDQRNSTLPDKVAGDARPRGLEPGLLTLRITRAAAAGCLAHKRTWLGCAGGRADFCRRLGRAVHSTISRRFSRRDPNRRSFTCSHSGAASVASSSTPPHTARPFGGESWRKGRGPPRSLLHPSLMVRHRAKLCISVNAPSGPWPGTFSRNGTKGFPAPGVYCFNHSRERLISFSYRCSGCGRCEKKELS